MPTPTTTYSLSKPTVGGDDNAWGTELNANLDKLDDLLDGTIGITPNLIAGWEVGGVAVTASAAELNLLDGVTASTAELNILDGVTASTAEINLLDGVTYTLTDLNSLTASVAELNVLDGIAGIASQVEAEAGTATDKLMTPERTKQAIDALVTSQSPFDLLGTLTTTSGTTQTLSGLDLTGYKFLFIVTNAVSSNVSGTFPATSALRLGGVTVTGSVFASSSLNTVIWCELASGVVFGTTGGVTSYRTSTTSISFSWTDYEGNTVSFDAGSIRVYGVK